MINNSKQDWSVGSIVKVGFLKLRVVAIKAVYDGLPDIYDLASLDRDVNGDYRCYQFIPHNGLTRIS